MIVVLATLRLLTVDVGSSPTIKVTFISDSFAEPGVELLADFKPIARPERVERQGNEYLPRGQVEWFALFETDLQPALYDFALVDDREESSNAIRARTKPWPPGCPGPTRWERLVGWLKMHFE